MDGLKGDINARGRVHGPHTTGCIPNGPTEGKTLWGEGCGCILNAVTNLDRLLSGCCFYAQAGLVCSQQGLRTCPFPSQDPAPRPMPASQTSAATRPSGSSGDTRSSGPTRNRISYSSNVQGKHRDHLTGINRGSGPSENGWTG